MVASYLGLTLFYMGPVIGDIGGTLYGFGDNTAGPVWRNTVSPQNPFGGFEDKTNFPNGEDLFSPVGFSSTLQTIPLWALSQLFSPVIAYNLLNIIGFVFTALVMYGFILFITKNHWIAWLAGFASSFAPYYQVKVGGHPSYAFSGIFVLAIWIFLVLLSKPSRLKAVSFGLVVGATFYFDPYFVLYQILVCLALFIGWVSMWAKVRRQEIIKQLRFLSLSLLTSLIALIPLMGTYYISRSAIQTQVASVRGNVVAEAVACSNYPHEYLLPFVLHPATRVAGLDDAVRKVEIKLKNNFSCGIGEDTVGVSITVLVVLSITAIILLWERINRRHLKVESLTVKITLVIAISLLVLGLSFGLPPKSFYGISTPTELLLGVTTTWRTLTRSYMLVNTALVILMSFALAFYSRNARISKRLKTIGYLLILLLIIIEYQAFTPFRGNQMSSFSLSRDIPDVYNSLKAMKDISTIVEYPLESYGESDAPSYYLSMQLLHNKRMLNSPSPTSSQEDLRRSVRNIADPQTIPALRALGIDAIVLHGVKDSDLIFLNMYEVSSIFEQPRFTLTSHTGVINNDQSVIVKINEPKTSEPVFVGLLEKGFFRNLGIIKGPLDWAYEAVDGAVIRMKVVDHGDIVEPVSKRDFCFMVRTSAPSETVEFTPLIDGVRTESILLTNEYTKVRYKAVDSIVLKSDTGSNMQISSLGCED